MAGASARGVWIFATAHRMISFSRSANAQSCRPCSATPTSLIRGIGLSLPGMHEAGLLGADMVGGVEDLLKDGGSERMKLGGSVLVDRDDGGLDTV